MICDSFLRYERIVEGMQEEIINATCAGTLRNIFKFRT